MKTCPVCKAQVFDDMPVCFGCMHRFDEDEARASAPVEAPVSALSPTAARDPLPASVVPAAAPSAAPEAATGAVGCAPVSMPAPAYAAPPAAEGTIAGGAVPAPDSASAGAPVFARPAESGPASLPLAVPVAPAPPARAYENAAAGGGAPAAAYAPLAFDAGVARFQLVVRLEPVLLGGEG